MFKFKLTGHIDSALIIKGIPANNQDFILAAIWSKQYGKKGIAIEERLDHNDWLRFTKP